MMDAIKLIWFESKKQITKNIFVGIVFCMTFTSIDFPNSLWIGMFSFLGADTIYKTLEGKVSSYTDITKQKGLYISKDNIINKEEGI